jgi:hypothetical protein
MLSLRKMKTGSRTGEGNLQLPLPVLDAGVD